MKQIVCYIDFVSPYSYLALEKLPETLLGLSYAVTYRPILLGALLKHHGNKAPAETPAKYEWTRRHVRWLGHELGVPLEIPAEHPFNPLPLLRLSIAAANGGDPNRYICETIFRHAWRGGQDANDPQRLAALRAQLSPDRALPLEPDDDAVKTRLRANTEEAISHGVFGVPAFLAEGQMLWGYDSLTMLRRCLDGDPWFTQAS